jgi:hypothetical protein
LTDTPSAKNSRNQRKFAKFPILTPAPTCEKARLAAALPVCVAALLVFVMMIWFSIRLAGPQDCGKVVDVRIGGMPVAGCDRR